MGGHTADSITSTWVFLVLVFGCCVTAIAAASAAQDHNIRIQCRYTRFPRLCVRTLSGGDDDQHVDFAALLLNKTIAHADLHVADFDELSSDLVSSQAQPAALQAIGYCEELMGMSRQRLKQALAALKESPGKNNLDDIQTWLSATVTFQQACKDSVDPYAFSDEFLAWISRIMEDQSQLASNALALVNRNTETSAAGRQLSEDIDDGFFPDWVSGRELRLLQTATDKTKANVVVAKDGTGNFKTVSEAIKAASGRRQRFVIYVKSGVYREKIQSSKDGITLIGDGKYSTIVTWDDSVGGGGSSLSGSVTFAITGDGFIAKDIGFQNTAGPGAHQAVALMVASDHSVFYRCSISGYQDTLYELSLRQFYRECDISGTVDFMFGNAAAVFQACNLVLRRPRESWSYNVVLANGRTDPGQNTGFSVQKCKITAGPDFSPVKNSYSSYLGRPWKPYSRAVVMESDIDGAISARGWIEWPGTSSSSLGELYFGEYANVGARGGLGGRVGWPGFHGMRKEEAEKFTVAKFIDGNSWLPSTGINFVSGL